MQLSFGANLHLIHKPLEKPLICWAFSIKKLSEVLLQGKVKIDEAHHANGLTVYEAELNPT